MWNNTRVSRCLGIQYPIIQGPFGGGASSVELTATVSNAGGLGSYGMQALEPTGMVEVARQIRTRTAKPFALNLWIPQATEMPSQSGPAYWHAAAALRAHFVDLGEPVPLPPEHFLPDFDRQIAALLEIAPPVFSFVFGTPSREILAACRAGGILTLGTASTVDEARALEDAGVDCIVASSFEAGGHKAAFLKPADRSLIGGLSLIPQIADQVKSPIVAAGGIADARGIAAAFALGAHGVQIGTAFLACQESAANDLHRSALFSPAARETTLTRAFSGRLARGILNRYTEDLEKEQAHLAPYPVQGALTASLARAALRQQRPEMMPLSAGQSAALLRQVSAAALMEELVRETPRLLRQLFECGTPDGGADIVHLIET